MNIIIRAALRFYFLIISTSLLIINLTYKFKYFMKFLKDLLLNRVKNKLF
jgi:hypothetical protein